MHLSRRTRSVAVAALLAGGGAIAVTTAATGADSQPITATGVGPIKLGQTATSLQSKGLIGKLTEGCELAGPGTRAAQVKAFRGSVGFTRSNPRKVNVISVDGKGPAANGVQVGDTLADIQQAYKTVKVDKTLEDTFQGDFVTVPKSAGGRIQFFIDLKTKKITGIGVPGIPVCE
jgi:hypothetical protein